MTPNIPTGMTEHVCPADIPDEIRDAAMAMALEAHRLLGCRGASRSDFRWDDEQGVDGPLSARGQHPAGHDAAEPGARAGAGARHRLCRAGRADRGGGVMTARIARGGAGAAAGRGARRRRSAAAARKAGRSSRRPARSARLRAGLRRGGSAAGCSAAMTVRGGGRRGARLPPAAARRHRARRGRRRGRLHRAAGRDQGRAPGVAARRSTTSPSTSSRWRCRWSISTARAQRLLRFGWIQRGAGLAPAARHAGDRRRRARAGRRSGSIKRQLSLIDADGVVLEPVRVEAMPDLPLVIGAGANRHVAALERAARRGAAAAAADRRRDLGRRPALGPALPDRRDAGAARGRGGGAPGDRRASPAWTSRTQLLGRGFVRFDMRDPRRAYRPRLARAGRERARRRRRPIPGQIPQDLARTI